MLLLCLGHNTVNTGLLSGNSMLFNKKNTSRANAQVNNCNIIESVCARTCVCACVCVRVAWCGVVWCGLVLCVCVCMCVLVCVYPSWHPHAQQQAAALGEPKKDPNPGTWSGSL